MLFRLIFELFPGNFALEVKIKALVVVVNKTFCLWHRHPNPLPVRQRDT